MPNRHYWPKSLMNLWVDEDGRINRMRPNGSVEGHFPKYVAFIPDGHLVDAGSPWTQDFEPLFDPADNIIARVFLELCSFEVPILLARRPLSERFFVAPLNNKNRLYLADCLSSIIVRSPLFRRQMTSTARRWNDGREIDDKKMEQDIILLNIRNEYNLLREAIASRGDLVVFISDSDEFIIGEGFLYSSVKFIGSAKFLIPVLPSMAIGYYRGPVNKTIKDLKFIRIDRSELASINYITQLYTKSYIYYRKQKPNIFDVFIKDQYLQYINHICPWLDNIFNEVEKID